MLLEKIKNRYGTLYLKRNPNVKWTCILSNVVADSLARGLSASGARTTGSRRYKKKLQLSSE
jgi:hypothetical protein